MAEAAKAQQEGEDDGAYGYGGGGSGGYGSGGVYDVFGDDPRVDAALAGRLNRLRLKVGVGVGKLGVFYLLGGTFAVCSRARALARSPWLGLSSS